MARDSKFKAFVDASAGSAGAVFSTLALYPLDYAKLLKQIQVKRSNSMREIATKTKLTESGATSNKTAVNTSLSSERLVAGPAISPDNSLLQILLAIVKKDGPLGLFVGIGPKCASTAVQAFTYFYCYSFLKSFYAKIGGKMTTAANLLLASAAGAINMSLTLPMEVITTRVQLDKNNTVLRAIRDLNAEDGLFSFWKGFFPSMVLVSNPAINYTFFDQLKIVLLRFRANQHGNKAQTRNLSAFEAFVLAAMAKAIATLITYPLIRAKVLMQAEKKHARTLEEREESGLFGVLTRIGQTEGIPGLYKGCNAQLLNTVLKSALMLMTQEKITQVIYRSFFALRRRQAKLAVK